MQHVVRIFPPKMSRQAPLDEARGDTQAPEANQRPAQLLLTNERADAGTGCRGEPGT